MPWRNTDVGGPLVDLSFPWRKVLASKKLRWGRVRGRQGEGGRGREEGDRKEKGKER